MGFGQQFVGMKFSNLVKPGHPLYKPFQKFLYAVVKHPYLAILAGEDQTIPPEVLNDKDNRLSIVVNKIIRILWLNNITFPVLGNREGHGGIDIPPPMPMKVREKLMR